MNPQTEVLGHFRRQLHSPRRFIFVVGTVSEKSKHRAESVSLLDGKNSAWPSASSAIRFCDGDSRTGRYAVASRDIPAGSAVVAEAPHVAVLLAEHRETHCFECFARLRAPLPCPTCAAVAFCSDSCRRAATATHHALECGLLDTLWRSGASVTCLMALRALTQKPPGVRTALQPAAIFSKLIALV